jgi:hypothetical protein
MTTLSSFSSCPILFYFGAEGILLCLYTYRIENQFFRAEDGVHVRQVLSLGGPSIVP